MNTICITPEEAETAERVFAEQGLILCDGSTTLFVHKDEATERDWEWSIEVAKRVASDSEKRRDQLQAYGIARGWTT